jgi:hypothetical protein
MSLIPMTSRGRSSPSTLPSLDYRNDTWKTVVDAALSLPRGEQTVQTLTGGCLRCALSHDGFLRRPRWRVSAHGAPDTRTGSQSCDASFTRTDFFLRTDFRVGGASSSLPPQTSGMVLPPLTSTSPAALRCRAGAPSPLTVAVNQPTSPSASPTSPPRSVSPHRSPIAQTVHSGGSPGQGIHASASSLLTPISPWKAARRRAMRARKPSAELPPDLELAARDPAQPSCGVGAKEVFEMLGAIPLFMKLSNAGLKQILERGTLAHFPGGATIVRENSFGSAFYLLVRGRVGVASVERHIDVILGPGQCFGESALAVQVRVRREASAIALEDVWCFRMSANDMANLNIERLELKRVYLAKVLGRRR